MSYTVPGKVAFVYPVRQTGRARAGFLFRRAHEFDYDHRDLAQQQRAFGNYEAQMREFVRRSRSIGPSSMKSLIPRTSRQVWLATQLMRLAPRLPAGLQRQLASLQARYRPDSPCA